MYLAKLENGEMLITHEVTVRATIERGSPKDFEKFIRDKTGKWRKVSIKSIDFKKNVVEVILYTSEPGYFSAGTIIPSIYSSDIVVAGSFLLRPLKAIENETSLYLCHPDLKLPEGIEIKERMPEVKVEQVLFPKKGEKFVVLC